MKIAFFTEGTYTGKIPRNHPNMRVDCAWICALDAEHFPLESTLPESSFDLGIIIVPKKFPSLAFDFFNRHQNTLVCYKWATMQEANQEFWQDWPVSIQIEYLKFLDNMDILYCHNSYDQKYYNGLLPGKDVRILPSLIIESAIDHQSIILDKSKRSGVMIGGNWCSWYSGQDSFFIAQEIGNDIWAPSMGRKQEYEDYLEDIRYLEYMNWSSWIVELSKRKYAVHLMRTIAAGSFQLNCAMLGIPCIGYKNCDTQRLCFPELSVDEGDLTSARRIAKHLKENDLFYDHVSAYAQKMAIEKFGENYFLEQFYSQFNG